MGGKRTAQPSGNAQGKEAASGDGAASQGGASRKRQTRELRVDGAAAASAEGGSSGQEESGLTLSPVSICVSTRFNPRVLAGRKAALEAALRKVLSEFGGRDCRVEWTRVGPSEDTLQRVLPLVLERVEPEGGAHLFSVCKAWRRELVARGFCNKTVQLCSALAEGGNVARLGLNAERRLNASNAGDPERTVWLDVSGFLGKLLSRKGSLHEWLQAASQEPDASFLSRGAVSTAQSLGLHLVRWIGKPQGRVPGMVTSLPGHSSKVYTMAISPDGTRVVSGSHDTLVKIWDVETGQQVCTLAGHSFPVELVAFSPDGTRVVSGSQDGLVKIWDAGSGAKVRTLRGHSGGVVAVVFSPDGKRVVSCADEEEEVKMWNAETGAEVWASRCHDTTNGCICAREGAEHGDENVVWKPECPVFGHASWVQAVAFSSDGKRVVSGSLDTLVLIWNAETGAGVRTLAGHSDCVHTVAFSLDGKRVVSGAADSLVILWDTATGAEVRTMRGHMDGVRHVEFSDDGTQVISGGFDTTVLVWDVASGNQVCQLAGNDFTLVGGTPPQGAISRTHRKDRHVITALGDALRIYEVPTGPQRIYEVPTGPQHHGGGAGIAQVLGAWGDEAAGGGGAATPEWLQRHPLAPVAVFKAPRHVLSLRCHGAAICVGCDDGAVCMLSAPFLTA